MYRQWVSVVTEVVSEPYIFLFQDIYLFLDSIPFHERFCITRTGVMSYIYNRFLKIQEYLVILYL